MRPALFVAVALSVLALLASTLLLPTGLRNAAVLAQVSSPPPAEAVPQPSAQVQRALAFLRSRHTGLAQRELPAVARVIVTEARRRNLDLELVLAVIRVESGGYTFAVSRVGALGLMQIMPGTGEELAAREGLPWRGAGSLFDPILNVQLGSAYLQQLSRRYGNLDTALAAYNWGPGRIDRRLRRGARVPTAYVQAVRRAVDSEAVLLGRRS